MAIGRRPLNTKDWLSNILHENWGNHWQMINPVTGDNHRQGDYGEFSEPASEFYRYTFDTPFRNMKFNPEYIEKAREILNADTSTAFTEENYNGAFNDCMDNLVREVTLAREISARDAGGY